MTDLEAQILRRKPGQEILRWWRFSNYLIREGIIVPAPGAKGIGYDPWRERRKADGECQREHRADMTGDPALDLLRLALKLAVFFPEIVTDAQIEVSDGHREAILQFVRKYGLLGVFHDYIFQLPEPRSTRVWVRPRGQWVMADSDMHSEDPACLVWETDSEGHLLTANRFSEVTEGFFLPTMPMPLPYPMSMEFFQHYGEPLSLFVKTIHLIYLAFDRAVANEWEVLNAIVDSASFRGYGPDGTARHGSLLTSLAEMLAQDLEDDFLFRPCRDCKDLMRTHNQRALYCSRQCQWNATQKAHRAKLATDKSKSARKGRKTK